MNSSNVQGLSPRYYSASKTKTEEIFQTPEWNRIPHKGMQTLPENEIFQRVNELGKQLAHAKNDREYNEIYAQFDELQAQFISSISPDRKALVKEGSDIISNIIKNGTGYPNGGKQKSISEMSFLEFVFLCKEGKINRDSEGSPIWSLPSGGTMSAHELCPSGIVFEFKENGNTLIRNTGGEWTITPTELETARGVQILDYLHSAMSREKQEYANSFSQSGGNNSLDVLA